MKLTLQHKDIMAASGPLLVTGGPGSGKTTLALLKAQENCARLEPGQEILFLSFSRSAVRQIMRRSLDVLNAGERRLIRVQTYHLFGLETLATHGRLLYGRKISFLYPLQEELQRSAFEGDWKSEQTRLAQEKGLLCFDRLAAATAALFEQSTAISDLFADKYPFVIVDEFQDTDNDQWRLIQVFLRTTDVVCLADPEQSIYAYRQDVDPRRIDIFKAEFRPREFDLGTDNHRSPNGEILRFARAVLRNESPLPYANKQIALAAYAQRNATPAKNDFESTVHAGILWTQCQLLAAGIERPSLAVLGRTNELIAKVSATISQGRNRKGKDLPPIEHDALLKTDLTLTLAAAQVMGSVLEWPAKEHPAAVRDTLRLIAQYYRLKHADADSPSAKEGRKVQQYDKAASAVANGQRPRLKAVKTLLDRSREGLALSGNFRDHWNQAYRMVSGISAFEDLSRSVGQIRNTDFLEEELARRWLQKGDYQGAPDLIERSFRQRWDEEQVQPECLLMTMHKSKGKEFDGVVLIEGTGKTEGFFFGASPTMADRRLLFVGITRARHFVTIIRPREAYPLVGSDP